MQLTVGTTDNCRKATKTLTGSGIGFYYDMLGGKEKRRLVITALSAGVNTESIKQDLLQQGVKITKVHAIHTQGAPRKALPLYLFKSTAEEDKVNSITRVLRSNVRRENHRT